MWKVVASLLLISPDSFVSEGLNSVESQGAV